MEQYIADEIGDDRLYSGKNKTELRKVKAQIRKNLARGGREITRTRELRRRVTFADLLAMVETLRGAKFEDFMPQRGDWARPMLLWAARQYTGMTLREIGAAAGGADYTAVAMTIKRFE